MKNFSPYFILPSVAILMFFTWTQRDAKQTMGVISEYPTIGIPDANTTSIAP